MYIILIRQIHVGVFGCAATVSAFTKLWQTGSFFYSVIERYKKIMEQESEKANVFCKTVEPAVIDQNMIINLIIEQGPKGEAGRLFAQNAIELEKVSEIRMEYLNILRIDNLWMLKNLVTLKLTNNVIEKIENLDTLINLEELDFSFNRITVIENLNNLEKLKILLLHENKISIVEGLNDLKHLTILNIANNNISDWEHAKYLRKFKNLYSLNMNGNPCAQKTGYVDYLIALIPQLIYYQYRRITYDQKQKAAEKHYYDISNLQDTEGTTIRNEEIETHQKERLVYNTEAFVEYLDDDFVFEQMFADDKEGRNLYAVNEETENAFKEYRTKFSPICHELYEFGLNEHDKRKEEIKLFHECVNKGKQNVINEGRVIIDEILEKRLSIIKIAKGFLKSIKDGVDNALIENIVETVQRLSDEFHELITDGWTKLMSNEAILHDQIEDVTEVFKINLKDMIDTFLVTAQGYFSQLRNSDAEYSDTINALILYYLSGFGEDSKIPDHLLDVCGDKDILTNNVATSRDLHLKVIDSREEAMISRLRTWYKEYAQQLVLAESKRNDRCVLEISHLMEVQEKLTDSLQHLQQLNMDNFESHSIFP